MKHRIGHLHVITDTRFGRTHADLAQAATLGGADSIQVREKEASTRSFLDAAGAAARHCRRRRVPLVINDRVDLALALDADGVHLGDDDLPIELARRLLGPDRIIGSSADNATEVERRIQVGADYVGIGPIFGTTSKCDTGPILGLEGLANAVRRTQIPLIAIGGITSENVSAVLETGVHGIAILSAVCGEKDPEEATRAFRQQIDTHRSRESR